MAWELKKHTEVEIKEDRKKERKNKRKEGERKEGGKRKNKSKEIIIAHKRQAKTLVRKKTQPKEKKELLHKCFTLKSNLKRI